MKYARIENGIVAEVIDAGANPTERMFTPELVAQMVEDPDNKAVIGGTWDGQAFGPIPPAPVNTRRVRIEAERRIEAGLSIAGTAFRCDNQSITRIHGLAMHAQRMEDASQTVNIVFKTTAGNTMTVTSAAQAWSMFDAASAYVAAVLAASAALQDTLPADFADDSHWL